MILYIYTYMYIHIYIYKSCVVNCWKILIDPAFPAESESDESDSEFDGFTQLEIDQTKQEC